MPRNNARRNGDDPHGGPGQDSFLDIVSNIVGILIILVMVACARVKTHHTTEPSQEWRDRMQAVSAQVKKNESLHEEVFALTGKAEAVEAEKLAQEARRDQLSLGIATVEKELDRKRQELGEADRRLFDLERQRAEALAKLEQIQRAKDAIEPIEQKTIVLKNHPTPISETVEGDELHFRLFNGRIAEVPVTLLLERVKSEAEQHLGAVRARGEYNGMVGPIAGFRMAYTLATVSPIQVSLVDATFLPETTDLGEPLAQARAPGSRFFGTLRGYSPRTTTVTLWVYPDAFVEFRAMRDRLAALGYTVAARPLEFDMPIAASPNGKKSSGQ